MAAPEAEAGDNGGEFDEGPATEAEWEELEEGQELTAEEVGVLNAAAAAASTSASGFLPAPDLDQAPATLTDKYVNTLNCCVHSPCLCAQPSLLLAALLTSR